jgi:hypothetical protein
VDPVPDPLLLGKSGSSGNQTHVPHIVIEHLKLLSSLFHLRTSLIPFHFRLVLTDASLQTTDIFPDSKVSSSCHCTITATLPSTSAQSTTSTVRVCQHVEVTYIASQSNLLSDFCCNFFLHSF